MTIDEFRTVELRIGTVREASRVEGSEKLLKLSVDLGAEVRQIVSGIGKAYEPDALVSRQVVVVANLDPRMMMGLESQGMVLAAVGEDGIPVLLAPRSEVPPGANVT